MALCLVGDARQKELQFAIDRHSDKCQEELKDIVGVAPDFNCDCAPYGVMWAIECRVPERRRR
jgi:hypothetical protein